mgnify:FL=1
MTPTAHSPKPDPRFSRAWKEGQKLAQMFVTELELQSLDKLARDVARRNKLQDRVIQVGVGLGFLSGVASKKTFPAKLLLGKHLAKRIGPVGEGVVSGILGAGSTGTVASLPRMLAPRAFQETKK